MEVSDIEPTNNLLKLTTFKMDKFRLFFFAGHGKFCFVRDGINVFFSHNEP